MRPLKIVFPSMLLILLINSCGDQKKEVFYFQCSNKEGDITSYMKKVVYRYTDSLVDTTFYYNQNKKLRDFRLNKTIFLNNGIKKNGIYYSFLKDTCHISIVNDDEVEVCYLDEHIIKINNEDFRTKKYRITYILIDGISFYEYYDKDYILLKKEYNNGYAPYFKEVRSETVEGLMDK